MPKLKIKSKQYLFKNKLNIRRKSKLQLIKESIFMLISGVFLLWINYFIPLKIELFNSFTKNIFDIFNNFLEILFSLYGILVVLFICFSIVISIFLFAGSFNRLVKIILWKSRRKNW